MTNEVGLEQRLTLLEQRVAALRSKKDIWDVLGTLGSLATPLVVAALGIWLPYQLGSTQRERDERSRDRELVSAEASVRVAKANVIPSLMDALLGQDPARRKLAVSALVIALPVEGPEIARVVAASDPDPRVQEYASSSLSSRRESLIRDLFAADSGTRIRAATDLLAGWRDYPGLIDQLVQYADANRDNGNGVYNTVMVLNGLSSATLRAHQDVVYRFSEWAERQGPKTQDAVSGLRTRLR